MNTKILVLLFTISSLAASGQNLRIGQIDTSRLLLNQTIGVYISVTNPDGNPLPGLGEQNFSISESADQINYQKIPKILTFSPFVNNTQGIVILILIDNSGSMYDTLDGKKTEDYTQTRIYQAKQAVAAFLASIENTKDLVGLVSYNTYYTLLVRPTSSLDTVKTALDEIKKPSEEEAYTELYAGMDKGIREAAKIEGRKVIIILTDGENYPYFTHSAKEHKEYGQKVYAYSEPQESAVLLGVSVFAINFRSLSPDLNLARITAKTGGLVFSAANKEELEGVYADIHNQVAHEYLIIYEAPMINAVQKYVKVEYSSPTTKQEAVRAYYASVVLGQPAGLAWFWYLAIFVLAGLGLWLLSLIKWERRKALPNLQVLASRAGSPSTQVLPITTAKTVIGRSTSANLTISGAPAVKENHATIVFDAKTKTYTVSGEVKVNNNPVTTKIITSGDVIDVGGTTIIFDDGKL